MPKDTEQIAEILHLSIIMIKYQCLVS